MVLTVLFLGNCYQFYPGAITADTMYTLNMGLGREPLSNWHPPLLSALWAGLFHLFGDAGSLWLVQTLLFFLLVLLTTQRLKSRLLAALAAVVLLAWPPLISNMGAILKDCWTMLALLLLTYVAWPDPRTPPGPGTVTGTLLAAVLVVTLRIDYLGVVLPFLVLVGWNWAATRPRRQRPAILAAVMAAFLLGTAAISALSGAFVENKRNPWLTVALWDIVGAQLMQADPQPVTLGGVTLTPGQLQPAYNAHSSDPLFFGHLFPLNLPEEATLRPADQEARDAKTLWVSTLLERPRGYLRHRRGILKQFLGWDPGPAYAAYFSGVIPNQFGSAPPPETDLRLAITGDFDLLADSPIWRYWVYLSIDLLIIALFAWRRRGGWAALLALTAGLTAARGMILPAADFRYGLWILIATLLAVFALLDRGRGSASAARTSFS